jgi:hypothetical protein
MKADRVPKQSSQKLIKKKPCSFLSIEPKTMSSFLMRIDQKLHTSRILLQLYVPFNSLITMSTAHSNTKKNPGGLTNPSSVYVAYFSQKVTPYRDRNHPYYDRNKTILGVFYSEEEATYCAENYVSSELGDMDECTEDYAGSDDDDDELYVFMKHNYDTDESCIDKVWVQCHSVEDASSYGASSDEETSHQETSDEE